MRATWDVWDELRYMTFHNMDIRTLRSGHTVGFTTGPDQYWIQIYENDNYDWDQLEPPWPEYIAVPEGL